MIAAGVANLKQGHKKLSQNSDRPIGLSEQVEYSQKDAAKMFNVSPRSVKRAQSVKANAVPEVVAMVEQDKISVFSAADLAEPPHGFGMTAAEVQALIDSKPLAQRLAADPGVKPAAPHGRQKKDSNGSFDLRPGTSASYLVRRLKRDHPEVAASSGLRLIALPRRRAASWPARRPRTPPGVARARCRR
jgi:hypothetical protein